MRRLPISTSFNFVRDRLVLHGYSGSSGIAGGRAGDRSALVRSDLSTELADESRSSGSGSEGQCDWSGVDGVCGQGEEVALTPSRPPPVAAAQPRRQPLRAATTGLPRHRFGSAAGSTMKCPRRLRIEADPAHLTRVLRKDTPYPNRICSAYPTPDRHFETLEGAFPLDSGHPTSPAPT